MVDGGAHDAGPSMACGPPQKSRLADRARAAAAFAVLAVALCVIAQAVSDSQQELAEVRRSTPDLDHGAQLFDTCGACHGPDGGGTRDGQVPRIGGQHTSVLWKQLVDYRHDRRWDLRMEHFADRHHLSDAQAIADVAAYIHQLEPNGPAGEGGGKLTGAGGALYAQLCRSCHGATAQGDAGRVVPRIAGVPRFVYRDGLLRLWKYLRTAGRHDALDVLVEELHVMQFLGLYLELWRQAFGRSVVTAGRAGASTVGRPGSCQHPFCSARGRRPVEDRFR